MSLHACGRERHLFLVVDDEPRVVRVLTTLLVAEGHEVVSAGTIAQGRALAFARTPCVALLDVVLPDGRGPALCAELLARPESEDVQVVLVSGQTGIEDVEAGLRAGASDYVKKPFERDELRLRVRTQLGLHEAQQEQRATLRRLRAIDEAAMDAVIMMDEQERIAHWNPAAEQLFGWRAPEALGHDFHELLAPERLRAAQAALVREAKQRASPGGLLTLTVRRRSGDELPVELSLAAARRRHGGWTVAIVRDLTERRRLELELVQARKLEAVGQLAAGIAHEINSPTQYVIDSLRFAREASEAWQRVLPRLRGLALEGREGAARAEVEARLAAIADEEDLPYLEEHVGPAFARCADGLARVARIVRSMKDFAHPDREEQSAAELERALESTLTIARNEYKYVAELETSFCGLPLVTCHLGALNQVFLNLLVNAAHAIEESVAGSERRGVIRVTTRQDGAFAEVAISDTGAGIPQEIVRRIFEPFFTTKAVGKGTGQGLAIARTIVVEKHGGTLTFETEPGRGTTFFVRVPIAGVGSTSRPP